MANNFFQWLGKNKTHFRSEENVIEQIQLIMIISGMDEPVDCLTFSQIVESNWTQPPSFFNYLIIEVLCYVLYSAADGVIGQRHF
jgi:hypothetical protein